MITMTLTIWRVCLHLTLDKLFTKSISNEFNSLMISRVKAIWIIIIKITNSPSLYPKAANPPPKTTAKRHVLSSTLENST